MDNRKNFKLYGSGVFSTIAFSEGRPFQWERHWKRLQTNAVRLGIDMHAYQSDAVLAQLTRTIRENVLKDGKTRLTFYDSRTNEIWPSDDSSDCPTTLDILIGERRSVPNEFFLSVSPFPINSRSPLAGIKSCNYLEPILSLDEVRGRGFHEAIRVNERGFVTSACMANVFWVKGGELFTPGLPTGCLAGTTREFVMENIDCREVEVGVEALDDAEAIFLTSAGIGVVRVAEFEGNRLEKVDHPILHLLPY